MSRIIDRDKFNAECGHKFAYKNLSEELKQRWALHILHKSTTVYTNWFYFKDPYPDADGFISCIKL